jgi:tRNA A-37 threonylcarbamoyl transferase component Bud32
VLKQKRQFGRYEIIKTLGAGGMGEVLLAKQTGVIERLVVIKKVLPHLAQDETFRQRFLDEMRVATSLTHGAIVQVYDFGAIGGELFMAMEFVDGLDLAKIIEIERKRGGRVPLPVALSVIVEVAQALGYAHSRCDASGMPLCIVHRDVSPQNILLSRDGQIKITDFGVAVATSKSTLTLPGTLHGKVPYMSPEQVSGKELDARSDQFSLGVVAYELFAGRRLFDGENDLQVIEAIKRWDVPKPLHVTSDGDDALDAIIMRMLEKEPDARFESIYDCAEAVKSYASNKGVSLSPKEVGDYVQPLCPPLVIAFENSFGAEQKDFRTFEVLRAIAVLVGVSVLVFAIARFFRAGGEENTMDAVVLNDLQSVQVQHQQTKGERDIVIRSDERFVPAQEEKEALVGMDSKAGKRLVLIKSEPPDADVVSGDKRLGKTPLRLEASKLKLEVTKDGYEPEFVTLSGASSGTVWVKLKPIEKGRLRFRYYPADAMVTMDGTRLQSNANLVDTEVVAGEHVLEIRTKNGEVTSVQIDVLPRKVLELGTIEAGK